MKIHFEWNDTITDNIAWHINKHIFCLTENSVDKEEWRLWKKKFLDRFIDADKIYESYPLYREYDEKNFLKKEYFTNVEEREGCSEIAKSALFIEYNNIIHEIINYPHERLISFRKKSKEIYSINFVSEDGFEVCIRTFGDTFKIHTCFHRLPGTRKCNIIPLVINEMSRDDKKIYWSLNRRLRRSIDEARKNYKKCHYMTKVKCSIFDYFYESFSDLDDDEKNLLLFIRDSEEKMNDSLSCQQSNYKGILPLDENKILSWIKQNLDEDNESYTSELLYLIILKMVSKDEFSNEFYNEISSIFEKYNKESLFIFMPYLMFMKNIYEWKYKDKNQFKWIKY